MLRSEQEQSLNRAGVVIGKLALIMLVALTATFVLPAAQAKDKPEDNARVYTHTYDEVFHAVRDAVLRLGWNVTNLDKEKGTIQGIGQIHRSDKDAFKVHIESISSKPESRVTIEIWLNGTFNHGSAPYYRTQFFSELQKVLATYE